MRTVSGSTASSLWRVIFTFAISLVLALAVQISVTDDADAKKRKKYRSKKVAKKIRGNPKYAAYVIDAKTGKVLHARNANVLRYPASLTKMMTLYLVFEDLKSGRIKKSDRVVMTKAGARRPPSKIGLRPGQSISVEQAILSLVTKSANDVATAIGDKLAGSEANFAKRMTRKARQLGMKRTTFKNASGLTARGQLTTAADMAKLGLALREHFPRRYRYFQTRVFKFGKRRYGNHNKLLGRVRGVDGIKTGYTRASGFNLVSSVSHGRRRIVAVVMGGRTGARRNAQMRKLIRAYLPRASRGSQRRLVARAVSSAPRSAKRVARAATVKTNRKITSRVAAAHSVKTPTAKDISKVNKAMRKLSAKERPTPQLRTSLAAEKPAPTKVDPITTAGISKRFQIQIAASDNQGKAMDMLLKAKARNKSLLGNAAPFTESIVKNGTRLYRARFAGFKSKSSAQRACKILKKQKYSCLALGS